MKQNSFILGGASQCCTIFLHLVDARVHDELVSCAHAQGLVLGLEVLPYLWIGASRARRAVGTHGIDPTLHAGTRVSLDDIWWIHADVETDGEDGRHSLEAVLHTPFLHAIVVLGILGVPGCLVALVGVVHVESLDYE